MKDKLIAIREFFWPILKPPNEENKAEKQDYDIKITGEKGLKELFELSKYSYEEEKERMKTVESKSIAFISSIGLLTAIVSLISKNVIDTISTNLIIFILYILNIIVLMLYIVRTVYFSVKTLERKQYHRIRSQEYINKKYYPLKLIIKKVLEIINLNSKTINNKVDMMVMSQEYFKRTLVTLFIFLIFSISGYFIKDKDEQIKNESVKYYFIYIDKSSRVINFDSVKLFDSIYKNNDSIK